MIKSPQQKHTVLLKLAEDIFQQEFAQQVNHYYQKLLQIKPKFDYIIQTAKRIGVDQLTNPIKDTRDTFYNAFLIRDAVFEELPDVLAKLRKIQTEFEKKVMSQYQKQAYKHKGKITPLPEDYLWIHVLPSEIDSLIMNILTLCPNDILAKYQVQVSKYKTTVQGSLVDIVDAATRNTVLSPETVQKIEQSTTLTEEMKNNIGAKATDVSPLRSSINDLNKIEGK